MSTQQSASLSALPARKQLYVRGLASGKSRKQAALDAGYNLPMAKKPDKIETPDVRAAFARLMRQRVPAHRLAQRIAEGLDAQETKFFQKDGKVTDSRDVVNYSERRAYAELAARFGGYHIDRQEHTGENGGPITFALERMG